MSTANEVIQELKKLSTPERAKSSAWFFKTNEGQYGANDVFIGVTVPDERKIAKEFFREISLEEINKLLYSEVHEHRQTGFMLLSYKFDKEDENGRKEIYKFYLKHKARANNWDLVDGTAHIIGETLLKQKDHSILIKLAKSKSLWDNRIAIISTQTFIRNNKFDSTFAVAKILLNHKEDLIHKAVGWMLREVGKKDLGSEIKFLNKFYKKMPRTMLRYAIERFDERTRQKYLKGEI